MNIAIFASAFHPHVGGVEELCRQIAHQLVAKGNEVIILTNRWPRDLPDVETFEGLSIYRLAFRAPENALRTKATYALTHHKTKSRMVDILMQHKIDILHAQCISTNGYYAWLAKEELHLPLVVTAQGELTMDAGGLYQNDSFMNRFLPKLLEDADYITGCSQKTVDDVFVHVGKNYPMKTRAIFNGSSVQDFVDAEPYHCARPYILGIGRGVPQKGFDVLIKAYAKAGIKSHDVIIAGDGPEIPYWKDTAAKEGVKENIFFYGNADRQAAVSLFVGSSFVALPSRADEGLPVVSVETMAAGKAIVASEVGGVPEAVIDGKTGFIVPREDVDALADALTKLCSDEELRNRFGAEGRARSQMFDWDVITDQYIDVYRTISGDALCQT